MTVRTTIATVDKALAQLTTSVKSQFESVNSQILEQQTAISDNTKAIASLDTYVQAEVGDLTTAVILALILCLPRRRRQFPVADMCPLAVLG